jgi:hypothetical protein
MLGQNHDTTRMRAELQVSMFVEGDFISAARLNEDLEFIYLRSCAINVEVESNATSFR